MKKLRLVSILLICCLLSGCWDKVEIDRRIFVSTIGVDVGKDIDKEKDLKESKNEELFVQKSIKKLKVSYAFPDISDFSPNKATIKGDHMFSVDTYSLEGAMSEISARSSRNVYIEHTRLIMLSRDLLKYPNTVREVVDYLQRQPKLNRRAYVIMTEGAPEEFIKFKPEIDKHIQSYISGLMDNSDRNGFILPVTLNEFLMLLSENGNALIPVIRIDKVKNELNLSGTAIIKQYELKGNLDPIETSNLEILRGKIKSGVKVIYDEGHPIDYEIDGIKRDIKVRKDDDKLVFDIKINLEGKLTGAYVGKKNFDKEAIDDLQNKFNKSIGQEITKVVQYLQSEPKVDPMGLNNYLEKFHPKIWKEVQKNWEEVFSNSKINIEVNTSIRRMGISN